MKCQNCGAQLNLEDKFCPYCGAANPFALQHQQEIERYDDDYQETRQKVLKNSRRFAGYGALVTIVAVLLVLLIAAIVVRVKAWDIGYDLRQKNLEAHADEHEAYLKKCLEEGDFVEFERYYSRNNLTEVDSLSGYYPLQMQSRYFKYVLEFVADLNSESDYKSSDTYLKDRCKWVAEELQDFYGPKDDMEWYTERYPVEGIDAYNEEIELQMTSVVKTYFGFSDDDMAQIDDFSQTKIANMIMEGIRHE